MGGWTVRAFSLDDAFNSAVRRWVLRFRYLASYLNHPICKPVLTSCINKGLSARIRSFRAKLQLALAWCAASKLQGLPLPLSLRSALLKWLLLPYWEYRHCVPRGRRKPQIGGKEEGKGLTWLPTLLASVLIFGSQYDVMGDPWS